MTELTESVLDGKPSTSVHSDWLTDGAKAPEVVKDAIDGANILGRLRKLLDRKFQNSAKTEYDKGATERERAFESGYRKALKDVYRLLHIDN